MPSSLKYFHSSNKKVAYTIYGDPSLSTPVIYFHGFPGSRYEVEFIHPYALQHGISVISFERPGLGKSEYDGRRSVLSIANIVSDLLNHLDIKTFKILAVSGGTPYALATAALLPERVTDCLILSGVSRYEESALIEKMGSFDRSLLMLAKNSPLMAKAALSCAWTAWRVSPQKMFKTFVRAMHPSDRKLLNQDIFKNAFLKNMKESIRQSPRGIFKELSLLVSSWQIPYEKIISPVTFLHGKNDTFVPPVMMHENAKMIPQSKIELIDNAGHFMFVTMGERVCGYLKTN